MKLLRWFSGRGRGANSLGWLALGWGLVGMACEPPRDAAAPSTSAAEPSTDGSSKPQATEAQAGPSDARRQARALVQLMSFEEKAAYIGGDRDFYIRAVPRLGIPEIKMADGPAGCRNWGASTAYPAPIGLAAAFDTQTARAVGESIARDCRARGVRILLAPGVNLARAPLSGRNFEYWGEDPLVAERGAGAWASGVQAGGVMATAKHFALNDQEWDRNNVDSLVDERALHELYLRPFEALVRRYRVGAVMTSYNLWEGIYASENAHLIKRILRDSWGFDGLVMSDWSAVHHGRQAYESGLDLEMPAGRQLNAESIRSYWEAGADRKELDSKVENILTALIQFGFLREEALAPRPADDPQSREVSLNAARKSLVLLQNGPARAPVLPLAASQLKKVAVIGPNAEPAVTGGSGSAYVTPVAPVSVLQGLREALPGVDVVTHPGVQLRTPYGNLGGAQFDGQLTQEVFLGEKPGGAPVHTSRVDAIRFHPEGSPVPGVPSEHYSIRWSGKFRVTEAATYTFMTNADDGTRVWVDGKVVAEDWTDHGPRLSQGTVALSLGTHQLVVEYYQGILGASCDFGFEKAVPEGTFIGEAALRDTIAGADAVVIALGFGQSAATGTLGAAFAPYWPPGHARQSGVVEAEDDDRPFALPEAQVRTVGVARELGKPVIVVGFSGGGVDFRSWLGDADAILWAFYPGTLGGQAIAEAILGQVNPGGRLPVSFAGEYEDHPAAASYDRMEPLDPLAARPELAALCTPERLATMPRVGEAKASKRDGRLWVSPYCEGVFMGYRGFARAGKKALFPFGFGLSYSTFAVAGLKVKQADGALHASLQLQNVSGRAGDEVVQIYVQPLGHLAQEQPLQLAGFQRVHLEAGASQLVDVRLSARAFGRWEKGRGYFRPAGDYEIQVSRSADEPLLRKAIHLPKQSLEGVMD